MMRPLDGHGPRPRRGVTIGEMLVYMVIAGVVLSAIYSVMNRQARGYARQLATVDVDESARGASTVLAWDIRHATMAADSVLNFASDSIVLRSVQGVGVICAINSGAAQYGIWKTGGSIDSTSMDSAMIYRTGTSTWKTARVLGWTPTPSSYGVSSCAWSSSRTPDLAIKLKVNTAADTLGILVGSPLRAYRTVTYKTYLNGGRWWLGRRVGSTGAFEKFAGPLPGSSGLSFSYHDSTGAATTDPGNLRTVKFKFITQSYRTYRDASGASVYRLDSISTAVAVRR
jgi:hypothetical protein